MQKDLSPLQQQQYQQQQRMAAFYAMQQQQRQQQQQGRLPPQPFGQSPAMYSNPTAMMTNDPSRLNQPFPTAPAQQPQPQMHPQQVQQGMYMRPPGLMQGPIPGGTAPPNGMPHKFTSPLQQQPQHLQQQLGFQQQQQQFQLQQQQQQLLQQRQQLQQQQPTPPQLPGRPAMVPTATTPTIGIRGAPSSSSSSSSSSALTGDNRGTPMVPPPPHGSSSSGAVPMNIPPIEATLAEAPVQKENLAQYQHRDRAYQDILNTQHKRHLLLAQEKKRDIEISQHERKVRMQGPGGVVATFGAGYQGLGNGTTGMHSKIIYPREKKRQRRTPLLKFSLDDMKEQATKDESLVPIRLEFEADGYKLRDTFTWNLNEQLVTPEQFAEQMCEDLRLPPASFIPHITRSIRDQVQDYYLHASSMVTNESSDKEDDSKPELHHDASSANTPIKTEHSSIDSPNPSGLLEDQNDVDKKKSKRNMELRMLIKLDITVGHKALIDQFEWDISCPDNSPELFAEVLSSDLGLGGEFRTAIAHSIREQVHVYTKSLLLVGHEFDGPVVDDDLKHSFLPLLKDVVRDADTVDRFTPAILELSEAELQKNEKDRLREARRKRRQTRGRRGIILPDREPLKTNRTTHETQPEQELTDEQFFANMNAQGVTGTRGSTPAQEVMHSQRRSAHRARANIAAEAAGHLPGNQAPSQPSLSFLTPTF